MTMTAAERNKADAYAGPGKKEPLYSSGAHLRAAWDLAGRVKGGNADAIRAKIRAFARRHGLTRLLPKTAQASMKASGVASYEDGNDSGQDDLHGMSRVGHLTQMAFDKARAADGEYGSFHRREVVEHAQRHGLARHLPAEAHGFMHQHAMPHDHGDGKMSHDHPVKKALPAVGWAAPAIGAGNPDLPGRRVAALLDAAWDLAEDADQGKPDGQRAALVRFAAENGLNHFLPERSANFAHATDSGVQMGRVDDPLGQTQTAPGDIGSPAGPPSPGSSSTSAGASDSGSVVGRVDSPLAQGNPPGDVTFPGTVQKAVYLTEVPIVSKGGLRVQKAWSASDGTCVVEGWVSTEEEDSEHDIVPPEAFLPAMDGYAKRRMPLSSEHAMKAMPIGHGQRVAAVRDGKVLKSVAHPTDAADFEAFPGSGTGMYGRFLITEPQHAGAVRKGNVGGFSWVGNLTEFEPRSGGGRTFKRIDPWLESTVAAYPINDTAVLVAAKAMPQSKES